MHTPLIATSGRSLLTLLILALTARVAPAQIGPYRGEIPRADAQTFSEPTPEPIPQEPVDQDGASSQSELVRPAMDELLLQQARAASGLSGGSDEAPASEGVSAPRPQSQPIGLPKAEPMPRSMLLGSTEKSASAPDQGWVQTIVALGGVLLLILGLSQVYKRLARSQGDLASKLGAGGSAPAGIVEVIGRYPISRGMTLVVLRFDRRVLLLSLSAPSKGKSARGASMQTLCELSDPEDIASILLKARSAAGESIAQSFEQTLREADDFTDEHLDDFDLAGAGSRVRFPSHRGEPARTITTDEGDRAELWSSGQDSRAAAGVLRQRLASMRKERR